MASALFSPITMRAMTLPNRVVVSPMCQYNSTDGSANDWHLMHLGNFSLGAAALVMTEMTNVNPVGRITYKCAGLYSDDNEKALKRVIDFCKQYGLAKQGLQVGHAGLTDAVVAETDRALQAHELIKVKIGVADRTERAALVEELCARTDAAAVQTVGKIAVLWRPREDE